MRAEFEARLTDPDGTGFFFAGKKDFVSTPDEGGCLVIIHDRELHLKENCEPVAVAPLKGVVPGGWNRFVIERTGSLVLVTLNGREIARSFVFSPGTDALAGRAGFFPGSKAEIRDFRLFLRQSRVDADRFAPAPPDVRFRKLPERVFRMENTRRRYGAHVLNGVSFEDVTLLRQKENALARSERDRQILSRENLALRKESLLAEKWIRGTSASMRQVYRTIEEIAATDATFLITGETGTGKEVIARFIHGCSLRSKSPFVKIDCAALPETLLEAELFGHEKGAFTGAHERRIGRFESADRGTVFLDEIANISPAIQSKLLRVVQDRAFERLGGSQTIRSDFRLICATNTDLEALVGQGRFRSDLLYRINTIALRMPSLKERREDIPLFARTFIEEFAAGHGRPAMDISEDAMRLLLGHPWPGNIRELRNTLERCVLLCPSARVEVPDLKQALPSSPLAQAAAGPQGIPSRRELSNALKKSRGSVEKAAKKMGLKTPRLYYLCKIMGVRPARFRTERRTGLRNELQD
jgi:DNA-binding NtrC family response regulator